MTLLSNRRVLSSRNLDSKGVTTGREEDLPLVRPDYQKAVFYQYYANKGNGLQMAYQALCLIILHQISEGYRICDQIQTSSRMPFKTISLRARRFKRSVVISPISPSRILSGNSKVAEV
eukprot:TRINITY_DN543_c0_g1_i2.p1 TRINITY_DN543_c0_g1~~TRINITY_DN543_c0_g1_i2.p1  ORF type:complete len:119 (+),score=4.20 TRINITY_DN543_c0_g1_i2:1132-1488(+)